MSSLVFLGISIIVFLITYGITFTFVPMILGAFFTMMPPAMSTTWQATNTRTQAILQYIIPLIPTIGLVLLVLKVLMVASVRGRD